MSKTAEDVKPEASHHLLEAFKRDAVAQMVADGHTDIEEDEDTVTLAAFALAMGLKTGKDHSLYDTVSRMRFIASLEAGRVLVESVGDQLLPEAKEKALRLKEIYGDGRDIDPQKIEAQTQEVLSTLDKLWDRVYDAIDLKTLVFQRTIGIMQNEVRTNLTQQVQPGAGE
jgi:hypothetical protein